MSQLLWDNTDVMADVLGFMTRRENALQLAAVSVVFSALCNCWCQPEEENDDDEKAASVGDLTDNGASFRRSPIHIRRRCWSCTGIHCVHIVHELRARNIVLSQSNGVIYLRNTSISDFEVLLHTGRSGYYTCVGICLFYPVFLLSVIRFNHSCFSYLFVLVREFVAILKIFEPDLFSI